MSLATQIANLATRVATEFKTLRTELSSSMEQSRVTVKNSSGATIVKGSAVYVSGANGTNVLISKAQANAELTSSKTLGLVAQDLYNNATGYVITEGALAGLDTSSAIIGDPVWLSPTVAGGLVFGAANKPAAPYHMVYLGVVTRVNNSNGEIFVRVQNGYELDELHDVAISNPASGDVVKYDGSKWVNAQPSSSGGITVSDTAPTSPSTGMEWFDSSAGRTYIRYDGYWVEKDAVGIQGVPGPTGDTGASGVVSVNAPLTNSGTSTAAVLGVDSTVARRDQANTFTNDLQTSGGSNGWSSFNYGKNMIVRNTSANPAIGIFDFANTNPLALVNSSGTFVVAGMPAITDSTTGPIWRLSVDSSGRLTVPSQVFFYAMGPGSTTTLAGYGDLNFTNAIVNRGSVYNTTNYRFTAPVSGTYMIGASLFAVGGSGYQRFAIKVNGTGYYGNNQQHTGNQQNAYIAMPVYLNANDYVTIGDWQNLAGGQYYMGHSIFYGYLLG